MGTDMHVAIEVRGKEYDFTSGGVRDKWKYIASWDVDRCYDLFGCFGIRTVWENTLHLATPPDLSREVEDMKEWGYGFYSVSDECLRKKVIGWTPYGWDESIYDAPVVTKSWLFDIDIDFSDITLHDEVWYKMYKMLRKHYGANNIRLIVFFDS